MKVSESRIGEVVFCEDYGIGHIVGLNTKLHCYNPNGYKIEDYIDGIRIEVAFPNHKYTKALRCDALTLLKDLEHD